MRSGPQCGWLRKYITSGGHRRSTPWTGLRGQRLATDMPRENAGRAYSDRQSGWDGLGIPVPARAKGGGGSSYRQSTVRGAMAMQAVFPSVTTCSCVDGKEEKRATSIQTMEEDVLGPWCGRDNQEGQRRTSGSVSRFDSSSALPCSRPPTPTDPSPPRADLDSRPSLLYSDPVSSTAPPPAWPTARLAATSSTGSSYIAAAPASRPSSRASSRLRRSACQSMIRSWSVVPVSMSC